jgi:phospholipid/cholesterol/gamma-HCH transport system ATP-binding protein
MVEIHNLKKQFSGKIVLRGVNLKIYESEKLVIIGRSGCGKSVLLKLIINLLQPDDGYILINGAPIKKVGKKDLFHLRKQFGFLFQSAALFDSMTVAENIALPLLEHTHMSHEERMRKVAEKLEMVGLPEIEHLKPAELSGGMKKRVGLARAIILDPKYILYDEPTTGLDPIMAANIDRLIVDLSERLKVTSVVVTHDMQSAFSVADRIVMLHDGVVLFEGTPNDLKTTKNKTIQQFIHAGADDSSQANSTQF